MSIRRLALLIGSAALLGAHPAIAGAACAGADELPDAQNGQVVAQATLCLLNEQRAAADLRPLASSEPLTELSAAYAGYLVSHQYFEHTTPSGVTLEQRLAIIAYRWQEAGENLAWGQGTLSTPAERVAGWMASPPHRANILRAAFREVGIGIVLGAPVANAPGSATYVTDFGTPAPRAAPLAASVAARTAPRAVFVRRHWYEHRSDRWWRRWLRRHHHGHHHHRVLRFVD
jgi:uncharacterized protein YkwD